MKWLIHNYKLGQVIIYLYQVLFGSEIGPNLVLNPKKRK